MNIKTLFALLVTVSLIAPAWSADEKTPPPAPRPAQDVKMKRVGVEEFAKLRERKDAVVLDVRTEKEFKAGHMPGAINIDVNARDFDAQVAKLDKSKPLLVHCTAGVRSRRACQRLDSLGFKELYDLAPGMNGWEKAGQPVTK